MRRRALGSGVDVIHGSVDRRFGNYLGSNTDTGMEDCWSRYCNLCILVGRIPSVWRDRILHTLFFLLFAVCCLLFA